MQYFEDLVEGEDVDFGRCEVDRDEVIAFARRYDPQPFHLDEEAAASTHFGRLAASGWHSCAMVMAVIVRYLDGRQAGLGSPGVDELRWLKPVFPGDTLHVTGRTLSKTASKSRPDMGVFKTLIEARNQHGEPVLRYISTAFIRRRPDTAGTD